MNKHTIFFSKLAVLITLSIFGNTLFAQNDFAFKLVKPNQNDQIINKTEELSVEITFNVEAVNEIGAYIATVADSKIVRFSAATTMESTFTDNISAAYLGEGKHIVEYMLLPSGSKDQTEALAKIAINIEIKGGSFKTDVDIESFTQDIVETIRKNDVEAFKSYCIDKNAMDGMINSIKGDSQKESGIKAELSSMNTENLRKEMTANFSKLQKALLEKNADRSTTKFLGFLEKDINLEMPEFSVMDIRFGIDGGNSFIISINAFITKDKAYLFDFEFHTGLFDFMRN